MFQRNLWESFNNKILNLTIAKVLNLSLNQDSLFPTFNVKDFQNDFQSHVLIEKVGNWAAIFFPPKRIHPNIYFRFSDIEFRLYSKSRFHWLLPAFIQSKHLLLNLLSTNFFSHPKIYSFYLCLLSQ